MGLVLYRAVCWNAAYCWFALAFIPSWNLFAFNVDFLLEVFLCVRTRKSNFHFNLQWLNQSQLIPFHNPIQHTIHLWLLWFNVIPEIPTPTPTTIPRWATILRFICVVWCDVCCVLCVVCCVLRVCCVLCCFFCCLSWFNTFCSRWSCSCNCKSNCSSNRSWICFSYYYD